MEKAEKKRYDKRKTRITAAGAMQVLPEYFENQDRPGPDADRRLTAAD